MKILITIALAFTLLALACGEEPVTEPNPHYRLVPTSPRAVLVNVEISFNQRDAVRLDGVLSKDFVFHFDPDDVGQNPPGGSRYRIPESWDYTVFWQAVNRMFTKAHSISLTIPTGAVGEPDPNATIYKAENINIKLLVMIDEINGYLADTGYCNFQFERYESEKAEKLWRLTKWWDNTATTYDANPGVEPASLGRILALYK